MGKKMSMLISLAFAFVSLFTFLVVHQMMTIFLQPDLLGLSFLIGLVLWELVMFMSILRINMPLVTTYALKVQKYAVLKPQTLS